MSHVPHGNKVDRTDVYKNSKDNRRLGIASAGDNFREVNDALKILSDAGCETVICACRTRGATHDAMNQYSKNITFVNKTIVTEGDLMTEYVANEAGFVTGGMLVLQSMEGGWAEDISNINGSYSKNPTNEQVQSEEYNKLFNEAVNKRIDFYKTQGDDYKGYTTPNSNKQPKAIREVFNNVNEDLK